MTTLGYSATLDRDHLESFKANWPCHGLPASLNKLWFQFESNGDLCGYAAYSRNGRQFELSESVDGSVMLALAEDAQRKCHPEHANARYGAR